MVTGSAGEESGCPVCSGFFTYRTTGPRCGWRILPPEDIGYLFEEKTVFFQKSGSGGQTWSGMRGCLTTRAESQWQPENQGILSCHYRTGLSDGSILLTIPTRGMIFLTLVAKNGEFRYIVFGICNNLYPFARIRYKMTSEMIANGCFWMGVPGPDRALLLQKGHNPCFWDEGMTHVISEWRRCRRHLRLSDRGFPLTGTDVNFRFGGCQTTSMQTVAEIQGAEVCFMPALSDGNIDPGLPFSQGRQPVFRTNSRKSGTIV